MRVCNRFFVGNFLGKQLRGVRRGICFCQDQAKYLFIIVIIIYFGTFDRFKGYLDFCCRSWGSRMFYHLSFYFEKKMTRFLFIGADFLPYRRS